MVFGMPFLTFFDADIGLQYILFIIQKPYVLLMTKKIEFVDEKGLRPL